MLGLVVGAYFLAALWPQPGLQLRACNVGAWLVGDQTPLNISKLLLAFLLFNAGFGMSIQQMWQLLRRPLLLVFGIVANVSIPLVFIIGIAILMQLWHNPREVQEILVGLAVIASMPVAGSSTTWVQNADGDLALSLGLVIASTALSPILTPLVLHSVGWMAANEYAQALHNLAGSNLSGFLLQFLVLPTLLGISGRALMAQRRWQYLRPWLKLCGSAALLLLCYSNAAVALPQTVVHHPDWDFLAVTLIIVLAMCIIGFVAGAVVGSLLRTNIAQKTSLIFSLGMTNNGTGLVVAAQELSHYPAILLPIIFYNLVQHIVAAVTDRYWIRLIAKGKVEA
jgi:BASS family bile acid:Na+ symporter